MIHLKIYCPISLIDFASSCIVKDDIVINTFLWCYSDFVILLHAGLTSADLNAGRGVAGNMLEN